MRAGQTGGGLRPRRHGRLHAGCRDLRDHERRRHHGAPARICSALCAASVFKIGNHRRPSSSTAAAPSRWCSPYRPRPTRTPLSDFTAHAFHDTPANRCIWPHQGRVDTRHRGGRAGARATVRAGRARVRPWPALLKSTPARLPGSPGARRGRAAQLARRGGRAVARSSSRVAHVHPRSERGRMDLRTYGIGAQIRVRHRGVQ